MISRFFSFLLILLYCCLFGQNYYSVNQSSIRVEQNNYTKVVNKIDFSPVVFEISKFRNMVDKKNKVEGKIKTLKNAYESQKTFPEKIVDGWHSVVATDNYNICSDAKVLIKNNQIEEFVVGDWIKNSLNFKVISSIKNAKSVINVDFGDKSETLELYFTYDLESPTVVEKPLNSAYVSFWSDEKKANQIKIWFEREYLGEIKDQTKSQPECYHSNTITLEVKPGNYQFKAAGRGSIAWEGIVTAREGECFSLNLNESNKID